MSLVNTGNQLNTFHYRNIASSQSFNSIFHQLMSDGVYLGGLLSKVDDNNVNLLPTVAIVSDAVAKVSIRCETQENALIGVSSTNDSVVMRLVWVNASGNYVDIISIPQGSILENDVVIGKANYSGATLVNFDYTIQTKNRFDILQAEIDASIITSQQTAIKYALVLG